MDQKGYVMGGLSFLLLIPAIFLVATLVDMVHIGSESQSLLLQSDAIFYAADDIKFNIPILTEKTLQKTTETVIKSENPLGNSRKVIKNCLQAEVDILSKKYSENEGINVKCTILSVDSSQDPFKIRVKSMMYISKGSIIHNENLSQDISIIDKNYPIFDPLPFIKCKNYGEVKNTSTKIFYGSSIVNLLKTKNMTNAEAYENATSPIFIKKCPYDPYIGHGNSQSCIVLKNCIENGYFHESSDGACFLCRLEGKATCSHYGFETFIVPLNSSNLNINSSSCSIDHVIFNETIYPGKKIIYYDTAVNNCILFLDNGHRQKYGLSTY